MEIWTANKRSQRLDVVKPLYQDQMPLLDDAVELARRCEQLLDKIARARLR